MSRKKIARLIATPPSVPVEPLLFFAADDAAPFDIDAHIAREQRRCVDCGGAIEWEQDGIQCQKCLAREQESVDSLSHFDVLVLRHCASFYTRYGQRWVSNGNVAGLDTDDLDVRVEIEFAYRRLATLGYLDRQEYGAESFGDFGYYITDAGIARAGKEGA